MSALVFVAVLPVITMIHSSVCVCLCALKPRLQLLGDSLGFVPLLTLNKDIDCLFDEVHV